MFYDGDTGFYVRIDAFYFFLLLMRVFCVIDALHPDRAFCVQVFSSGKSMDIFRLAFDFSAMKNAHHFQLLFQISLHEAIFSQFYIVAKKKALKNMENVTNEK